MTAAVRTPTVRGRVLAQTLLQLAGKGVTMSVGLIVISLQTRYLGVHGFGDYTFVVGYIALFAVLSDLGSQAIAVREMSRSQTDAAHVAAQYFNLKIVLGTGSGVLALIGAAVIPLPALNSPGVRMSLAVYGLTLFLAPLTGTASAVFQSALRMQVSVLIDVASRLGGLVAMVVIVLVTLRTTVSPATRLILVVGVASALALAASMYALAAAFKILAFRPRGMDRSVLMPMLANSLPLAAVLIVGMLHYRVDVFVLSAMRGNDAVGLYAIAVKLLDVSLAIAGMFVSVAFPVLSARSAGTRAGLQRAFDTSLDFMMVAGCGIAVAATAFAPVVVAVLGGARYAAAVVPLAVIAWAVPIMFTNQIFSHMVVAANKQYRALPVALVALAANVALNVLLIPRLGVTAPAIATVLSEALSAAGIAAISIQSFGFGPRLPALLRIALCAVLAVGASRLLLPAGTLIAGSLAVVLYAGTLLITGALRPGDLRSLVGRSADPTTAP